MSIVLATLSFVTCASKQPLSAGRRRPRSFGLTDPARAGAGAIGDVGTHAEHLARYITGLEMERLFADVSSFVPGRRIDDDANMLVHFQGGKTSEWTVSMAPERPVRSSARSISSPLVPPSILPSPVNDHDGCLRLQRLTETGGAR